MRLLLTDKPRGASHPLNSTPLLAPTCAPSPSPFMTQAQSDTSPCVLHTLGFLLIELPTGPLDAPLPFPCTSGSIGHPAALF